MKKKALIILPLILLSTMINLGCQPLREFDRVPVYKGDMPYKASTTVYDSNKKTVVIVANTEGTELFDLMAPFYLFNCTEKANVYIVAEKKSPISLLKGFFTMPNFTFRELDSLKIQPDVIVLPAMINVHNNANSLALKWFKENYTDDTKVLSICQGSLVAAASGIYDNTLLTTHASLFKTNKSQFNKPIWVKNIAVTKQGNLYSTAGVANAAEGSLSVINDMFGKETLRKVMEDIQYPYSDIRTEHHSIPINTSNKFTIANKLIFKKNRHIGVLLQNGINEFELAAVLDTYTRSFPYSNETVTVDGLSVTSKFGLTFYPSAKIEALKLDELHVLMPQKFSITNTKLFDAAAIVNYDFSKNQYIFNTCLSRISTLYGSKFENISKQLLDYNE